jgi:hypothetical protein
MRGGVEGPQDSRRAAGGEAAQPAFGLDYAEILLSICGFAVQISIDTQVVPLYDSYATTGSESQVDGQAQPSAATTTRGTGHDR